MGFLSPEVNQRAAQVHAKYSVAQTRFEQILEQDILKLVEAVQKQVEKDFVGSGGKSMSRCYAHMTFRSFRGDLGPESRSGSGIKLSSNIRNKLLQHLKAIEPKVCNAGIIYYRSATGRRGHDIMIVVDFDPPLA